MKNYIKPNGKFALRSIIILIISLIVTILIFMIVNESISKQTQKQFDEDINKIQDLIKAKLILYEQILKSGEAFYYSSVDITRDEWFQFFETQQISQRYPGIQGIGFQKHTSDKEEFLKDMEELKSKNLLVRDIPKIDSNGYYNYIIFLEPLNERNKRAMGYDMSSEDVRNSALVDSTVKNAITISGKVTLVQETTEEKQAGFLMYLPIYEKGKTIDTAEERIGNLVGHVYAPFRTGDFIDSISHKDNSIGYVIYDSKMNDESIMYEVNMKKNNTEITLAKNTNLDIFGRNWAITFYGYDTIISDIDKILPSMILIIGISISVLFYIISNGNITLNAYKQRQIQLLKETNRQKDEFTAMITHELRTPLTPIIGNVDFLNNTAIYKNLTIDQKEAIKSIEKNTLRLDNMITDILDAEKLNMNQMKFHYVDFNVTELFNDIKDNFAQDVKAKNISMTTRVENELKIYSDRQRLQQVLENLVRNACDFVQNDSGKIELTASVNKQTVEFAVKDNGIGITQEAQKGLFKKFYQIDTSHKRKHGGSGLGLSICKGIIESLGGEISVKSQSGEGTTFCIQLPNNYKTK